MLGAFGVGAGRRVNKMGSCQAPHFAFQGKNLRNCDIRLGRNYR